VVQWAYVCICRSCSGSKGGMKHAAVQWEWPILRRIGGKGVEPNFTHFVPVFMVEPNKLVYR
jgi:hypothetical protein